MYNKLKLLWNYATQTGVGFVAFAFILTYLSYTIFVVYLGWSNMAALIGFGLAWAIMLGRVILKK